MCAYFLEIQCKKLKNKKRKELEGQFKDCILSVTAGLRAGLSVENAFIENMSEIKLMCGETSQIVREFSGIIHGMKNNITLEQLLFELSRKTESSCIQEFAEVFSIAKRNGGNLIEIIIDSAEAINYKISVEQEIEDVISGKKFEQKIMNVIPFFIIAYVQLGNPGYFNELYYNVTGIAVMTTCLLVYVGAYMLSEKITNINV